MSRTAVGVVVAFLAGLLVVLALAGRSLSGVPGPGARPAGEPNWKQYGQPWR